MLQLTGAALAATVGSGYAVAENRSNSIQESEPIEFESSEELLLDATLLPENGWTQGQVEEGDVLDVSVTFQRNVSDDGSNFWVATSAAAGRETEAEAVGLYEELAADFVGQVGEGRTMDLDLASEAVIAGYDGFTGAIFRDVNCVGAVGFADCTSTVGCISHVARTESIARAKRQSWRGALQQAETLAVEVTAAVTAEAATVGRESSSTKSTARCRWPTARPRGSPTVSR